MNKIQKLLITSAVLIATQLTSATEYNLQTLADEGGMTLVNRSTETAPTEFPETVYLTMAPGDGLGWIDEIAFSEGTIELEVKGENRPGASFVGFAFHGANNTDYDVVYLRPFNFQNADRKDHSLQYVSLPKYDWSTLRSQFPGKYESALEPAPAPEDWVHLKLVVTGTNLDVYVDHKDTPELKVKLLNDRLAGKVGIWAGNGSDGQYRYLKITPATK